MPLVAPSIPPSDGLDELPPLPPLPGPSDGGELPPLPPLPKGSVTNPPSQSWQNNPIWDSQGYPRETPVEATVGKVMDFGTGAKGGLLRAAAGVQSIGNAIPVSDQVNGAGMVAVPSIMGQMPSFHPLISDESLQHAHDVATEQEQAALATRHSGFAKAGDFVGGAAGYVNPVLAPVLAAGGARNDVLDASGNGILANGNKTAANLVGLAAGGGASLSPAFGRYLAGQAPRLIAPVAKPILNAAGQAMGFTAPEALATEAAAQADPRLQESADQQMRDLLPNAALMTGIPLAAHGLSRAASRLANGAEHQPLPPLPQEPDFSGGAPDTGPAPFTVTDPTAVEQRSQIMQGVIKRDSDALEPDRQQAFTERSQDAASQLRSDQAAKADVDEHLAQEQARRDAEQEKIDTQTPPEQETLSEITKAQELARRTAEEDVERQRAYIMREDIEGARRGIPGAHYYDDDGKLSIFEPEQQPNPFLQIPAGPQRTKAMARALRRVKQVLGDDMGRSSQDDPTMTPAAATLVGEQPYPGAKKVTPPGATAPRAEDVLAMKPAQRRRLVKGMSSENRQALAKDIQRVRREQARAAEAASHIHPFNEVPNARSVRKNPRPSPQQGDGNAGSETRSGSGLQQKPEARNATGNQVQRPAGKIIDRTHDIPLAGGISNDGKTVYLDREMPTHLTMDDGKVADVVRATQEHESAEHAKMAQGHGYVESHNTAANPAENAYLRSQGINPAEYNAKLKPSIDAIATRNKKVLAAGEKQNLPPDLHDKHVAAGAKEALNTPSGIAPGERITEHPEIANPGKTPAERDAWTAQHNQRDVEPVTNEEVQKQADARISADSDGEARNIIARVAQGHPINNVETRIARDIASKWYNDPTKQAQRRELTLAYEKAGTENARAMQQRADDLQAPGERGAQARGEAARSAVDLPSSKLNDTIKGLQKDLEKARADLDRERQSPTKQSRLQPARQKVDDEYRALIERAKKVGGGTSFSSTGGEHLEIALGLLSNRIKAGALKFTDAALDILSKIPAWRKDPRAKQALMQAWERLRKNRPELDAASDPATLIHDRTAHTKPIGPKTEATVKEIALQRRVDALEKKLNDAWALDKPRRDADKAFFKAEGFDLDNLDAPAWKDPREYNRFRSLYQSRRISWKYAVAQNIIIAPIHASFQVISKKFLSDAVNAVAEGIKSHASPVISSATGLSRIKGAPRIGEITHIWSALQPAMSDAWHDAVQVAKGGASRNEAYAEHQRISPLIAKTMPGSVGRGVAHGDGYASLLTPVRIVHSLMATATARLKVAAHAFRTAVDQDGNRLLGEELEKYMRDQVSNLDSESWRRATLDAQRATFTEPLPAPLQKFAAWKSSPGTTNLDSAAKLAVSTQVPFIGIPFNRFKQVLQNYVPIVSDISDVLRFSIAKDKEGNKYLPMRDIPDRIVQAGIRWGIGYGVASLMSQMAPDGKPMIVGNSQDKDAKYTAWTGGHRRNYLELGSVGPGLGLFADYWHGVKDGKIAPEVLAGIAALSGQHQEPLVAPITDTIRSWQMQPKGRDSYERLESVLAQKLGRTAGSLSPSFSRQIQNATRDTVPDYRYSRTASVDFMKEVKEALREQALPSTLPDKMENNKPKMKDQDSNPVLTVLDRLMNPIKLGNNHQTPTPGR